MSKAEKRILGWLAKNINYIFYAVVTVIAVWIRMNAKDFLSSDSYHFLIPWFYEIRDQQGIKGLGSQVGDYNLLYQTIIALFTYLPVKDNDYQVMYLYKILSCAFDFLLANATAFTVSRMKKEKCFGTLYCAVYCVILFLPTVIMNSAFWAQCDAIYASFSVLCFLYLYEEKYFKAFLFLGISFAFKLQTIFLLPFVIAYYFYKKNFSILWIGVSAAAFWLSGAVAYLNGRPLTAPFTLYLSQTGTYEELYLNICSFWMLFGNDYPRFKNMALVTAVILCGLGLFAVISGKKRIDTAEQFLHTAAWFVWSCVFFLPAMHDRYAYLQDILLIMAAFLDRKYIKYAVVSFVMSFMAYAYYLTWLNNVEERDSLILFFVWAHFTYTVFFSEKDKKCLTGDQNCDKLSKV